jgi:hypothetical protein
VCISFQINRIYALFKKGKIKDQLLKGRVFIDSDKSGYAYLNVRNLIDAFAPSEGINRQATEQPGGYS